MKWLSIQKAIYCALRPALWRQLAYGVAPTIEHVKALRRFSFRTVVDVGANRGQFATFAHDLFPAAKIIAFEPQTEPASVLRRTTRRIGDVHVYENAIGDRAREATIYVTTRDDSSSLLAPTRSQQDIFGVSLASTSKISVKRLSDCIGATFLDGPALLKIDVQGAELDVLNGCCDLLGYFDVVYVECSFVPMYERQPLFRDVEFWMDANGFRLAGTYNQHDDRERGAVQADFLFTRVTESSAAVSEAHAT